MVDQYASVDERIARISQAQHGIVTTRQLVEMGLTKSAVAKRAQRGRLHRVFRGVYSVGHPVISEEARWMAAVLACGPDAALSHGAAAVHWGLLKPGAQASPRRLGQPLVHQSAWSRSRPCATAYR